MSEIIAFTILHSILLLSFASLGLLVTARLYTAALAFSCIFSCTMHAKWQMLNTEYWILIFGCWMLHVGNGDVDEYRGLACCCCYPHNCYDLLAHWKLLIVRVNLHSALPSCRLWVSGCQVITWLAFKQSPGQYLQLRLVTSFNQRHFAVCDLQFAVCSLQFTSFDLQFLLQLLHLPVQLQLEPPRAALLVLFCLCNV